MIASVYLLLINLQNQLLVLKRQNTGYKDGEFGLPAGHVDGGETLMKAMIREAHEEVGVDVDPKYLQLAHVLHRFCGDHERLDFFFVCRSWNGEPTNCEKEKCEEIRWVSQDDLPENTIDYYKQAFDHISRGSLFSSWFDETNKAK